MIYAWSLLYEELNGTMDETYPIKEEGMKDDYVSAYRSHTGNYLSADTVSFNFSSGEDGLIFSGIDNSLYGFDSITFEGESEWERIEKPKPEPDLDCSVYKKYQEEKGIKDLQDYIASTYSGHYTSQNNNVQTLDLIQSVGDAESFCRSNAIKYLSRYDKRGQAKRDILKAMHYCLLLYYFSGQTYETPTRGYETF